MTARISAAFDSGNIRVVSADGDRFALEIVKDLKSDFYQWFHFRLTGAAGREVELRIVNAGGSAYPGGWPDYGACVSEDRRNWRRTRTEFADGILTIRHVPATNSAWFAYFAPYSMERHHDLVARIAGEANVAHRSLGLTLDGQELDCLTLADCCAASTPATHAAALTVLRKASGIFGAMAESDAVLACLNHTEAGELAHA